MPIEIPVDVHTNNPKYIFEMIHDSEMSPDQHWEWAVADGLKVRTASNKIRMAFAPIHLVLLISEKIGAELAAKLFAEWLFKTFNNEDAKVINLEIDRTTIEFDEGKIKKVIYEKITKTTQ